MGEDIVKSITEDFKALLIKSQKYVKQKDNVLKQYAKIVNASKNIKLKRTSKYLQWKSTIKKIEKYENYFKRHQ